MNKLHSLKLKSQYFDLIANGFKTYEGRLNDEKRQLFNIGDKIIFIKEPKQDEKVEAKIINKIFFKDFEEMAEKLDKSKLGFQDSTKQEIINTYYSIYDHERVEKYGVVIFEIELI